MIDCVPGRDDAPLRHRSGGRARTGVPMIQKQLHIFRALAGIAFFVFGTVLLVVSASAQEVLKIGVLGVMSGPAASWGLVNKYCAETSAELYNEQGGVDIGGKKYKIDIVAVDDKNDPKLSGLRRRTSDQTRGYPLYHRA